MILTRLAFTLFVGTFNVVATERKDVELALTVSLDEKVAGTAALEHWPPLLYAFSDVVCCIFAFYHSSGGVRGQPSIGARRGLPAKCTLSSSFILRIVVGC